MGPANTFLLGALTKSLATIVTYPYILAKSRLQSGNAKNGFTACLKNAYEENGFGGLYQGMGFQLSKAVLCQGILFMTKDRIEKLVRSAAYKVVEQ
jgi:solute carrier family 25 (peroxisomal adenine nucleotide transporter), member 17